VRSAHAGLHVAVIALANRQFDLAVDIADANLDAARQAENATLLSGFEAIRAESLQQLGQDRRAAQARRDSQFWSVLAFGNSQDLFVEAQAQIAGMAPTDGVVP
jgi:hypothetical protein